MTVDGNSTESVTDDDGRDMLTQTISGQEYNTSYEVEVTAINSCDIPSQPATTRATTRPKIRGIVNVYTIWSVSDNQIRLITHIFPSSSSAHSTLSCLDL